MTEKISKRITLSVILITLAGQLAWGVENQFFNVFMYNVIAPIPIFISIMVAASAITATITSIVMGALSDIKGKRRVFMTIGFIFWTITTALFPLSGLLTPFSVILAVIIAILFDCVMTFFGSTAYDANFNAYVTDITTQKNRGKLLSVVQIMSLLAILVSYAVSGLIIEAFGYYAYFFIIAFFVGIIGISGAFLTKDSPNLKPLETSFYNHLKSTLKKTNIKNNKDFFLVLSGAALWGLAFNIFFPFVMIYLQHYLQLEIVISSILLLILFVIAMGFAYPMGILIDKLGRKKIAIISVICECIFLLLFALMDDLVFIIITGTLWVSFVTTFTISSNTWIKDLYPEKKYGQFSGYFILFTVLIPMIPGPLIGGWLSQQFGIQTIIDGQPGYIPTPIIFVVSAFMILLTIIPLVFAKEDTIKNKKVI
jgi:MFS family permease